MYIAQTIHRGGGQNDKQYSLKQTQPKQSVEFKASSIRLPNVQLLTERLNQAKANNQDQFKYTFHRSEKSLEVKRQLQETITNLKKYDSQFDLHNSENKTEKYLFSKVNLSVEKQKIPRMQTLVSIRSKDSIEEENDDLFSQHDRIGPAQDLDSILKSDMLIDETQPSKVDLSIVQKLTSRVLEHKSEGSKISIFQKNKHIKVYNSLTKQQNLLKSQQIPREQIVKQQILHREKVLKNRPLVPEQRAGSARVRNKSMGDKLESKQIVQQLESRTLADSIESAPYEATPFDLDEMLENATKPRLTSLSLREESSDFRITLGNQKFKNLWCNSQTQADKIIIKKAYENFMARVDAKSQQLQSGQFVESSSSSESESELILEEDGGQKLDLSILNDKPSLQMRFINAILKKLKEYQIKLQRQMENEAYAPILQNLDIRKIQAEIDAPKILAKKRQPLVGSDLVSAALEKIYFKKKKFSLQTSRDQGNIQKYTEMLEKGSTLESYPQRVCMREKPKKKLVKRGFIFTAQEKDASQMNPDEMIEDPASIFDDYLFRHNQSKTNISDEFQMRMKFNHLSSIYRFNSTIYEIEPTAEVALIKACAHYAEQALPILTKIKNQELNLTRYKLEVGHFKGLAESFKIKPDLITKITLIECGIDEFAFTALCEALTHLNFVEHLQVHYSKFSIEALPHLVSLIHRPTNFLQSLVLSDVQLQPTTQIFFFEQLGLRSNLKKLHLNNFKFGEKGFSLFIAYFRNNRSLKDLSISNIIGIRTEKWYPFFEALAHNKTLCNLDLSNNTFVEAQWQAIRRLFNPYSVYKKLYQKWIKLGPGQKFPKNPLDFVQNPQEMADYFKKPVKKEPEIPQTKVILPVPEFLPTIVQNQIKRREEQAQLLTSEIEEIEKQRQEDEVLKLMMKSLKQSFALSFMKKDKKQMKIKKPGEDDDDEDEPKQKKEEKRKEEDKVEMEFNSQQAMVITEAIYKHIRRNQNLQHLDLTSCNLSQVMIGRIGLGVKCSTSLMSVHFSNNPGVTPAVKAFLQVKLKATTPEEDTSGINNSLIEEGANLQTQLKDQLETLNADNSVAQDTQAIKDVNQKLLDYPSKICDYQNKEDLTLFFTRLLGHKLTIPGMGRWKIMTQLHQKCWICEKYQISFFIWSPQQIAQTAVTDSAGLNIENVVEKIKYKSTFVDKLFEKEPVIYSKFTNWQPQKMIRVDQFAYIPQQLSEEPDWFKFIVNKYDLGPGYEQMYDFDNAQQKEINDLQQAYLHEPRTNWKKHIGAFIQWKKPQFPGLEFCNPNNYEGTLDEFTNIETNPIYILPALVKPGKCYYAVQFNKQTKNEGEQNQSSLKQQFYLHKAIIPSRDEELPPFKKNVISQIIERQFVHKTSVFAKWLPDTKKTIPKAVTQDMQSMNLSKLCKTETDLLNMTKVLNKHWIFLRNCYIDLLSQSEISPYIGQMDYVDFYRECQLTDEGIKASSLDLLWTQVKTNDRTRIGMNRGEFFELLVRIAKAVYVDTQKTKNLADALDSLVLNQLLPRWNDSAPHKSRLKHIWTVEVNDLLQINLPVLEKVHQVFWNEKLIPPKKWISQHESEQLFCYKLPEIKVFNKVARKCYFFAKMSVTDEVQKMKEYDKLLFVEFLEMICRVAMYHFDTPEYSELTFVEKVSLVLDNLCSVMGIQKKEVNIETKIDSDGDVSDCDY